MCRGGWRWQTWRVRKIGRSVMEARREEEKEMGSNGGAGAVSGRPAFRPVPIRRRSRLASIRRLALMVTGAMGGGYR